nr:DUF2017 family protein [Actinomycetales bacterium]
MRGFVSGPGGYVSRVDETERSILARLAADVAALIADEEDYVPPLAPDSATSDAESDAQDPIAYLDFDPAEAGVNEEYLALDPALARVFPPMSLTDPELAGELRSLTMDDIRQGKLANLHAVVATLTASRGQVRVTPDGVGAWLTALTDMRLVLASRLGIDDDDDAERVHDLAVVASRDPEPAATADDELELALASLYSGVTWWQESLLQAVAGRA